MSTGRYAIDEVLGQSWRAFSLRCVRAVRAGCARAVMMGHDPVDCKRPECPAFAVQGVGGPGRPRV